MHFRNIEIYLQFQILCNTEMTQVVLHVTDYYQFILYNEYHGCQWRCDAKTRVIELVISTTVAKVCPILLKKRPDHTFRVKLFSMSVNIDGLVQERCNSIANALELCLSCTCPSIWSMIQLQWGATSYQPSSIKQYREPFAIILTCDLP